MADRTAPARRALAGVQAALRPRWRRALVRHGTDRTAAWAGRPCVVVAPHPDDETLGCGATIARKRAAGARVVVVVAADGGSSHASAQVGRDELVAMRRAEVVAACGQLGVAPSDVVLLGHPDGTLPDRVPEVAAALAGVLADVEPDHVLVTSWRDWHPDHAGAYHAAEQAVRTAGGRATLHQYPVWWWMEGPWLRRPGGRWGAKAVALAADWRDGHRAGPAVLVATGEFAARKRAALAEHRSQTVNITGEATWAVFDDEFVRTFLDAPEEVFLPAG
jgi:LmbE family N-acetylglucosaminyl deacetylase